MNKKLILSTMLLLALILSVYAAEPLPELSKLQSNESMIVLYHSQGCFGAAIYEFTFRKNKIITASIAALEQNRKELGRLQLTDSDLTGLDKLLNLYRRGQPGISTTTENISLTLLRNGKVVSVEKFTDNSGFAHELKKLVTFPEIAGRLEKLGKL